MRPAQRSRSAPPLWRWRTRTTTRIEPLEEASIDEALIDPSPSPTYAVATTGVIDIIPFQDGDPETDAYDDGLPLDGDPDVEALGEIDEELSDPAMADEPETLTGDRPWETYVKTDADLEADAFFASFTAREAAEAAAAEAAAADASADEAPAEGTPADEAPADELARGRSSSGGNPRGRSPGRGNPRRAGERVRHPMTTRVNWARSPISRPIGWRPTCGSPATTKAVSSDESRQRDPLRGDEAVHDLDLVGPRDRPVRVHRLHGRHPGLRVHRRGERIAPGQRSPAPGRRARGHALQHRDGSRLRVPAPHRHAHGDHGVPPQDADPDVPRHPQARPRTVGQDLGRHRPGRHLRRGRRAVVGDPVSGVPRRLRARDRPRIQRHLGPDRRG